MQRRILHAVAVALVSVLLVAVGPFLIGPAAAASAAGATSAPAHSLAAARTHAAIPHNAWQKATLGTQRQSNWYRVSVTSRGYLYAMLGTLPANYNLRLYDAAGKQLNASDHAGTDAERIGRMLNPGTYFLRVASTKGFAKKKSYDLMARVVPPSARVGILTAQVGNMGGVVGEMVNVSDEWLEIPAMDVWLYGASGKLLKKYKYRSANNWPWIPMAPGARAPFQVTPANIPQSILKRTVRVKVLPYWSSQTSRTPASLKVSSLKHTSHSRNGLVWVDWSGKVTNPSNRNVHLVSVLIEARDRRGVVVGLNGDRISLPAKTTKRFHATYENWRPNLTFNVVAMESAND